MARLPDGPATGTAVIDFLGVGQLDEPFSGECSGNGTSTEITGSADTAMITIRVTDAAAQVSVDDIGLSADGDLAAGRYEVEDGHLSLDAPLVNGGEVVGSVRMELRCGA